MKDFLTILIGTILAATLYVSATYNLYEPDPAFYISYPSTIVLASILSSIVALIFFGYFKWFKVKTKNLYWLFGTAFVTQLVIEILTHTILFNLGVFGVTIAFLMIPAFANFLLDKSSKI